MKNAVNYFDNLLLIHHLLKQGHIAIEQQLDSGRLTAASPPGQGACFTVWLRCEPIE